MENNNPRMFWKLIKDLKTAKSSKNPIDPHIWQNYFKTLGQKNNQIDVKLEKNIQKLTKQIMDKKIKIIDMDKDIDEKKFLCI